MNDVKYCYPNSDVLKNHFDIQDSEKLFQVEKRLTMLRLLELQNNPIQGKFDLLHLCKIHQHIFQDLYSWAGQLRTVDIAKGNLFCKVELIESAADKIFSDLKQNIFANHLKQGDISKQLAYFFSEINALHPFREGNGRTQREFIRTCALSLGYELDFTKTTATEMLEASKASFVCEYGLMENLFEKCLMKIE